MNRWFVFPILGAKEETKSAGDGVSIKTDNRDTAALMLNLIIDVIFNYSAPLG
jgi:hypothetical protein